MRTGDVIQGDLEYGPWMADFLQWLVGSIIRRESEPQHLRERL